MHACPSVSAQSWQTLGFMSKPLPLLLACDDETLHPHLILHTSDKCIWFLQMQSAVWASIWPKCFAVSRLRNCGHETVVAGAKTTLLWVVDASRLPSCAISLTVLHQCPLQLPYCPMANCLASRSCASCLPAAPLHCVDLCHLSTVPWVKASATEQ